jgi:DNA polymerase III subunit epsilon
VTSTSSLANVIGKVRQAWQLYHLENKRYRFMFDEPPPNEWVALDCETTGLDVTNDEIISVAALRIVGNTLMTSNRLELLVRPERRHPSAQSIRIHRLRKQDIALGISPEEAMSKLLHFIGSRPLVGYYLEFDLAMIERALIPVLGRDAGLPQRRFEVSAMYYDYKLQQLPPHRRDNPQIDLRFASLMEDLGLPKYREHDPLNDATMAALAFVKLRHLLGR